MCGGTPGKCLPSSNHIKECMHVKWGKMGGDWERFCSPTSSGNYVSLHFSTAHCCHSVSPKKILGVHSIFGELTVNFLYLQGLYRKCAGIAEIHEMCFLLFGYCI